jgi:Icc-related predicted phosphoesterase
MKIVAISDMHGILPDIPSCDLLLIAGDICPVMNHEVFFQAEWLDTTFRRWLEALRHVGRVIGIAGNHDFVFEKRPDLVPGDLPWIYLQDALAEYAGLRIWGTPWQPWFHNWAFNGQPDLLKQKWALMPDQLDVIVVHGPPHGYGDAVPQWVGSVRHTGCSHLLTRILQIQPELVVFGHIHEGRGQWQIGERTTLANVTLVDVSYDHVYQPWVYHTRPHGG